MTKTDNFFIIHNYNTVPTNLLEYCNDYVIYDCSDDGETRGKLDEAGIKYVPIPNSGHNLTSYFKFFADNYENLPEVMCLLKGNMIGRHCTKEYFDKVYDNKTFTYLYEDKDSRNRYQKRGPKDAESLAYLAWDNMYLERNTSWYVDSPNHPHRYFDDLDDLLRFVFKNPVIPQYTAFSPGGCYVVRREQVRKHTPEFYRNLNKIMSYELNPNFPSEAHQIERIFPIIFDSVYEDNDWMNDEKEFDRLIEERIPIIKAHDDWKKLRFKRIRLLLGQKPY